MGCGASSSPAKYAEMFQTATLRSSTLSLRGLPFRIPRRSALPWEVNQYLAETDVKESFPTCDRPLSDSPTSCAVNPDIEKKTGYVGKFYIFDNETLHRHGDCVVRRILHKNSCQHRALKTVSLRNVEDGVDEMRRQVNLQTLCVHPNVIRLYETFVDRLHYNFILEYCEGGKLSDHITEAGMTGDVHNECETASVMLEVFRALEHMHSKNVCHRDIRPEHILIKAKGGLAGCSAKVIDFGSATQTFTRDQEMHETVGKAYYRAPEVNAGRYTQICDLWSCGVVMYLLLIGYPKASGSRSNNPGAKIASSPQPSGSRSTKPRAKVPAVTRKPDHGSFIFDKSDWDHVSQGPRRMLAGLLEKHVKVRFTAEQVVKDVWIMRQVPQPCNSRMQLAGQLPRLRMEECLEPQNRQKAFTSTEETLLPVLHRP